ncbi:MAG: family 1 encapsulin nanocompartment shell protein [Bacteroidales bacterium]
MDILRKSFAPISARAWEEINEEAKDILMASLTARKVVGVEGPKGIDTASVSLGELDVPANQKRSDVQYGVHKVLPLLEIRMPFSLNIWELDNISRGSETFDLDKLGDAAKKLAAFEENAIYNGFDKAGIEGLLKASEHPALKLGNNVDKLMDTVVKGMLMFKDEGIEDDVNLVVSNDLYTKINSQSKGYPLRKHLLDTIGGKIIPSDVVKGGLMLANDEEAFRMTLGSDISIGYEDHDRKEVHLYLTESFTFRVIDPAAIIVID